MSHYHIRWAGKAEFDWERYRSRGDAQERAELLVGQGETYASKKYMTNPARVALLP